MNKQPLDLVIPFYKKRGETPLQALHRFRHDNPEYKDEVLSYAGRLDPMAEGILLVLIGEANKKRQEYLHLDKEYEVDILCGIETDTYDVLGIPNPTPCLRRQAYTPSQIWEGALKEILKKYTDTFNQPYPPYSSHPVQGKPLFEWAREGRLNEIVIPTKQVTIYSCELLELKYISLQELLTNIQESIGLVIGDFRQEKILENWEKLLLKTPTDTLFTIIKLKVSCSSGTYMRSLAHALGKEMRTGAIALVIKRTRVGKYTEQTHLYP